jgi:UDP-glucose 4-epimerase
MNVFISGGAGFIGSNILSRFLGDSRFSKICVYDNLSSGTRNHIEFALKSEKFQFINADIGDINCLKNSMKGFDLVIHLAANPDIAKAATQPDIDFLEGTVLTQNILESMRINKVPYLLYTSGSGVYGEKPDINFSESYGPCIPISTYGASKLACESLIASYCHMFGMSARVFRFANVVGPMQTHGVGYDFIRKLNLNPDKLEILGDGTQLKSYIHIEDIINAIEIVLLDLLKKKKFFDVFNVATDDVISVSEIAYIACEVMSISSDKINIIYSGGDRGWKGDVPKINLDAKKIKEMGFLAKYNSESAIRKSLKQLRAGHSHS